MYILQSEYNYFTTNSRSNNTYWNVSHITYHELYSKITAIRGELIFAVLHYTTITVQLIVVTTTIIWI